MVRPCAIIYTHNFQSGLQLDLVHGDLTEERVDAIVNAANSYLQHGGGVAGAIVSKGGEQIQRESNAWIKLNGPVTHAIPAVTGAGRLPSRWIIHAVGPVWGEGNEDAKLVEAINGTLQRADELAVTLLAIPPISTGIFGFPKERAAALFFQTISGWALAHPQSRLKIVRITIIDQATLASFQKAWFDWQAEEKR